MSSARGKIGIERVGFGYLTAARPLGFVGLDVVLSLSVPIASSPPQVFFPSRDYRLAAAEADLFLRN